MSERITKHFVYVDGRRMHYRRCGTGPVVALFHASPVSARVHVPFMRFLSDRFTTLAFDTPSNGLSEPLPLDQPTIEDYADAMAAALRELGVEDCATYGRHTGASIAIEVANRHPDLTTMALTDGLPNFTDEQREKYLSGYLSDLEPTWDGGFYLWLWFRYRDQHVFWPWNAMDAKHRADTDVPDNTFIQRGVIEMLEAGNAYKAPYIAAFLHKPLPALESSQRPLCLGGRPGDSLYKALSTFPASTWTEEIPRESDTAMARERELFESHPPTKPAPTVKDTQQQPSGLTWQYVEAGEVQLFVMRGGADHTERPPILFLPSVPGAVEAFGDVIKDLAKQRSVFAIDPLGCGNSWGPRAKDGLLTLQTGLLADALTTLGLAQLEGVAISGGATVAVQVAIDQPDTFASLNIIDPIAIQEDERDRLPYPYAPDIAPRDDGTHMAALWHHVRDQRLWFPYTERTRAAAHPSPNVNPKNVHHFARHLVKHTKSYQRVWQEVIDYPLVERLADVQSDVAIWRTQGGVIPRDKLPTFEHLAHASVKDAESYRDALSQINESTPS